MELVVASLVIVVDVRVVVSLGVVVAAAGKLSVDIAAVAVVIA